MMIELPVGSLYEGLFMKQADDYIPIELWHEAKKFIQDITDDVDIYNKFRTFEKNLNEEALKFVAWWEFKRYLDFPHALFLLYENFENINKAIGNYDVMDGFNQLQMRLILYYRLLKENEIIND